MKENILDLNIDSTINQIGSTYRKPRGVYKYEYDHIFHFGNNSFGSSIYASLLTALSSVFEFEGLPEELQSRQQEIFSFILQSGRIKIIKVGSKFYPVHISPKKYNHYGDWLESSIIEPYLPSLNGKKAESFPNIEIKNDVLGESLIRKIYPFLEAIDDALFNLKQNQSVLAGKYIYTKSEGSNRDDNTEIANAFSNWLIDGTPVKVITQKLLDNGESPLQKLEVSDSTQSFIETIQYNYSQLLNTLGIPNNNVEGKKERLITDEINVQNIIQSSIVDNMLEMKKRAIKDFNETFGMNAVVRIKNELLEASGEVEDETSMSEETSDNDNNNAE